MATFNPNIPLAYITDLPLVGSRSPVVFKDLSYHIESFTDDEIVTGGSIVCTPLISSEKDEVMLFYQTNKNLSWDFVNPHDGETYSLKFIDPPPRPKLIPSEIGHYTITISVMGVKT